MVKEIIINSVDCGECESSNKVMRRWMWLKFLSQDCDWEEKARQSGQWGSKNGCFACMSSSFSPFLSLHVTLEYFFYPIIFFSVYVSLYKLMMKYYFIRCLKSGLTSFSFNFFLLFCRLLLSTKRVIFNHFSLKLSFTFFNNFF